MNSLKHYSIALALFGAAVFCQTTSADLGSARVLFNVSVLGRVSLPAEVQIELAGKLEDAHSQSPLHADHIVFVCELLPKPTVDWTAYRISQVKPGLMDAETWFIRARNVNDLRTAVDLVAKDYAKDGRIKPREVIAPAAAEESKEK